MDPRRDPLRLSLASYPMSHSITARFGDMDVNGHLNNVALASYYEDARVAADLRLFPQAPPGRRTFSLVVAQVTVQYLAEAPFPGTYTIGIGVSRVGTTSFTHSAGLFRDAVCLGLCDAVIVHLVDGKPVALPPDLRAVFVSVAFPAPDETGMSTKIINAVDEVPQLS
ncbi:thioesterase family protein [Frankia sp. R82]|uniref:acyl-CoA thioesterase n=1 Tax=Frankia sp. R82 TaxID=2950553 RepID=UPI002044824A|nr:thioesterase family protein [Frankia sp. R82]MCM3886922.1 thioesterase family protein [Frankia sp. R82]